MQQRGQHRTSNELRKQRVFISGSGVRSVWFRHNLENFKKRLKALEGRASDDEACGEIETAHPGYLGSQDIFYVGNLKGVGRIYQQTLSARLCVLFFLTIGCQKMMAAARLTMSVLQLNIPSGGMMLSGLLPGGCWFAQLCVLHLTVIGAVLYLP
ncbi:transposase [Salmonella enterica subsp. enterica serovar Bergen str. ST350]|nr:transposase [Salmonella enterica subsp. enterica serovar Bergen str. ST350]